MSRRPANFVQADVTRVLRAAQQAGPDWRVEIEGGVIRVVHKETKAATFDSVVSPTSQEEEPSDKWSFG